MGLADVLRRKLGIGGSGTTENFRTYYRKARHYFYTRDSPRDVFKSFAVVMTVTIVSYCLLSRGRWERRRLAREAKVAELAAQLEDEESDSESEK